MNLSMDLSPSQRQHLGCTVCGKPITGDHSGEADQDDVLDVKLAATT